MTVVDNRLSDEILVEWGMTFTLNFEGHILDWPRILRIAGLIDMEQKWFKLLGGYVSYES